jgi:hypothetical protein
VQPALRRPGRALERRAPGLNEQLAKPGCRCAWRISRASGPCCYTQPVALQLDAAVLSARARPGLLSWVGSGRLIFSLNYNDADFEDVLRRFVAAARTMQADGWWWQDATQTNKSIRRGILREMLRSAVLSRVQACRARDIGSSRSPRSRCSGALVVELMSWKGSVRILVGPGQTGQHPPMQRRQSWATRNSSPATPSASQAMPTSCT